MLNKQINELPPTTILKDVDLLVTDRFLGSGYYGTRSITVKNFKDTIAYPPPYDIGTVTSGNINVLYDDGFLQKALISGNCSLNVPPDGGEGKHMEFVFTADGADRLLNFSGSYARASNVAEVFPIKLKANTVTFIHTYRTATSWMITYIGANANLPAYTYAEMKSLITNSDLIAGKFYKISDFQLMWNDSTSIANGFGTVVRSSGVTEPLFVLATSSNTLAPEAYSELNPNDIVYYDINATYSVGWGNDTTIIPNFKGWIYRRIDTVKNIDIGWDWRYIKNTCYKYNFSIISDWNSGTSYQKCEPNVTQPDNTCVVKLSGKIYFSLNGTGNVNKNPTTQTAYWAPASDFVEADTYFSNPAGTISVIGGSAGSLDVSILSGNFILQPTFVNTLTATSNLDLTQVEYVRIESGFNNVIFYGFRYNKIGTGFQENTINLGFSVNVINADFYQNNIGAGFYQNIVDNGFAENSIGASFIQNRIASDFYTNFIREYFIGNNIGVGFISNIVSDSFKLNTVHNNVAALDFNDATHVYGDYNCTIFSDIDMVYWLSYYGAGGVLITTSPTT